MPFFDLPLGELEMYRAELAQPDDFDVFWSHTLREAGEIGLNVRADPVETQLTAIRTWDVTFAGFGGHEIRAWLHLPRGVDTERRPAVSSFRATTEGAGYHMSRFCGRPRGTRTWLSTRADRAAAGPWVTHPILPARTLPSQGS
jgi:cephalosporin-C deacetylase